MPCARVMRASAGNLSSQSPRSHDAPVLLSLPRLKALADVPGEAAALDRRPPSSSAIYGLTLRADCYVGAGDSRSASSFYLMAVRAVPPGAAVPPELAPELKRAQQMCDRYAAEYTEYLRQSLAAKGFDETTSSPRFAESLDIVLGKKRIFVQQPRYYYFPGLPQIQFYDRRALPWLDEVEAATDAIRTELLEVMKEPGAFKPYVEGHANRRARTRWAC